MAKPGKPPQPITWVADPLVIIYLDENDNCIFQLHPPKDYDYQAYGLLICDLIRQTALAFKVPEAHVFDWVEQEWRNPTTQHQQWAFLLPRRPG